jgi:branched-chain amino acid transport system substrate-binding protein
MSWRAGALALLVPWALAGCSPRQEPEPLWVGHLAPLSGPDRARGQAARQGILLAVEEARAAGQTVAGRRVAVRHADTQGKVPVARAETVRLLAVNKVVALLAGPESRLAAEVVQSAGSYNVGVVVPGELPDPPPAGALPLGARPGYRGQVLARYAARQLKAKRAALLTDARDPISTAVAAGFARAWPRRPSTALGEWTYEKEGELDDLLGQVRDWKPGVVLIAARLRDFGKLCARLRAKGVKGPVLHGGADVGVGALRRVAADDPNLYTATVYVYARQGLSERGEKFAKSYEERFGEPPDLFAVQAHDSARLLLEVLQEAQSVERAKVREALLGRESFEALTGTVSWKERRPRRRLFLLRLSRDEVKLVRTVPPEDD